MPRPRRRPLLLRLINLWPPYLGAGIRVTRTAEDLGTFEVRMNLGWSNRNYVGTQFGGSLYSMCDPFYMLILMHALGDGYVVWDKAASIRFRRPGRTAVTATFHVPATEIEAIRRQVDREGKAEPVFRAEVVDEDGQVVAEVEKRLHVSKKTG
jgi:acyl-coenzyme A thioesterase PaaI-like protein